MAPGLTAIEPDTTSGLTPSERVTVAESSAEAPPGQTTSTCTAASEAALISSALLPAEIATFALVGRTGSVTSFVAAVPAKVSALPQGSVLAPVTVIAPSSSEEASRL